MQLGHSYPIKPGSPKLGAIRATSSITVPHLGHFTALSRRPVLALLSILERFAKRSLPHQVGPSPFWQREWCGLVSTELAKKYEHDENGGVRLQSEQGNSP